ncbi:unnamed protein product [Medioppia subpectinata]|uniref:F-box domain-containing protein n=1 Tax=Medioppia subpectinata TaxID=1979941 RepID=A0A7R9KID6_9ACAR|nr:unnamed protein product [Medioppia subpectinata]CAG2102981.1 unnamed protein product [Medioppia subpectinata]
MAHEVKHSKTSHLTTDDGNEDNKHKPQIYAKNSIDRFGDDLCALLLSYFPLEDHIRCESLSKQFRRTVFRSLLHITIDNKLMRQLPKSNIRQIMATIAIKCGNIETIDCREINNIYKEHIPEVLTTFRDNCRHLRQIYCNLWRINSQTMRSFAPLITRIDGIEYFADRDAITHYHRLSHLRINSLRDVFDRHNGTLLAKNLHSFELNNYLKNDSDEHQLSAFVAQNLFLKSAVFMVYDTFHQLFQQFSRLTQLRDLRLSLWLTIGENSLSESLRTIGLNCKQLQRLTLQFNTDIEFDDEIINGFNSHSLDSLRCYRRLKRLNLALHLYLNPEVLEPLTLCHRLTHLTLNSREMSDKLIVNCDKQWPRLQYLSIKTKAITRECLHHISRLPALQMLCLQCHYSNDLTDNGFYDVLSKSAKLKDIEFIENNTNRKILIIKRV